MKLLKKGQNLILMRWGILLAALLAFFLALRLLDPFTAYADMTAASDLKMQLLLTFIFALPAVWLVFGTQADWLELLLALLITAVILYLRTGFFEHKTMDHQYHLDLWLDSFQKHGGFAGLKDPPGNYNLPYLYLVAAASYVSKSWIFLKLLALPFEFLAAFFAFKITQLRSASFFTDFLSFALMLCLPTVILNNSYWGQCDIIFASLVLGSLYFLLTKRGGWALAFWGLAFSFKMQAFFIAPLYFVLWLHGDVRLRDLFMAPLSYLAIHIPGVCLGYPLSRIFSVYFGQMAEVEGSRNYVVVNAPNVYHFFAQNLKTPYEAFSLWGICMVMIAMLLLGFWAWTSRSQAWGGEQILLLAAFISIFVPYFLPGMEDRTFFMADLCVFLAVFRVSKMLWPAVLTNFASWMAYSYFLYGEYWVDFRVLAAANGLALILCGILLKNSLAVSETPAEERA